MIVDGRKLYIRETEVCLVLSFGIIDGSRGVLAGFPITLVRVRLRSRIFLSRASFGRDDIWVKINFRKLNILEAEKFLILSFEIMGGNIYIFFRRSSYQAGIKPTAVADFFYRVRD